MSKLNVSNIPSVAIITGTTNPPTNFRKIYPKNNGWYDLDSSGTEKKIGSSVWSSSTGTYSIIASNYTNNIANGPFNLVAGYNNQANASYNSILGGGNNYTISVFSNIVGGKYNAIIFSEFSNISGGFGNYIDGTSYSTIGGGKDNKVTQHYSIIGGGAQNKAYGYASIIVGGGGNKVTGSNSIVIGGGNNKVYGSNSIIGNGSNNKIENNSSAIINGSNNLNYGTYSLIGGGLQNKTYAQYSNILGGKYNLITSNGSISSILGGSSNRINQNYSIIGGGQNNNINGEFGTIGGGFSNTLNSSAFFSTIGGGSKNKANSNYSTVSGGYQNYAEEYSSTIAGGYRNIAAQQYSSILGGSHNHTYARNSSIVGGKLNNITSYGKYAIIGGGRENSISSYYSSILGGSYNTNYSNLSSLVSGSQNRINKNSTYSIILGGNNNNIGYNSVNSDNFSFSSIINGKNNLNLGLYSSVINGKNNIINLNVSGSSILAGSNITGSSSNTAYVPYLNVGNLGTGSSVNNLGIDINGFIVSAQTNSNPKFTSVSANTISGSTLYSGSTNLYSIFQQIGSSSSNSIGVFFVNKNYTGTGGAIITGLTLSSVTSTATTYNSQLASAQMGSINNPYPDPFSARNAAMDQINSSAITSATIIILNGNWTVGSDNSSYNGDLTGNHPNSGVIADIGFSQTNGSNNIASLYQNNINYQFYPGTSLTYINSHYTIWLGYNSDNNNNLFKSKLLGSGEFYQIYGEVNNFGNGFIYLSNMQGNISFEAYNCIFQQDTVFQIQNCQTCNIKIDNVTCSDTQLFLLYDNAGYPNTFLNIPSMIDIYVKNLKWGLGWIPYPEKADYWYLLQPSFYTIRDKYIKVKIDNLDANMTAVGLVYFTGSDLFNNIYFVLDIDNLKTKQSNNGFHHNLGLITMYYTAGGTGSGRKIISAATNTTFVYNIKNAITDNPLISTMCCWNPSGSSGNSIFVNVGNHTLVPNSYGTANVNCYIGGIGTTYPDISGEEIKVFINGHFVNEVSGGVIFQGGSSYPSTKHQISGTFIGTNNYVADFSNMPSKRLALTNCVFANSGLTETLYSSNARNVYIQNVSCTSAVDVNITQIGSSAITNSDLISYIP